MTIGAAVIRFCSLCVIFLLACSHPLNNHLLFFNTLHRSSQTCSVCFVSYNAHSQSFRYSYTAMLGNNFNLT
ncbi:hypothetical protein EDC01DRAFT_320004 [Geopyxis carbonaria]|nr:hypothetical protein EDC01DRAFT_320004 [Geopyxis carbonaria]